MTSVPTGNLIDLSLDEIIRLNNHQNRQRVMKQSQATQTANSSQHQDIHQGGKTARQRVQKAKRFLLNNQTRLRNPNFNHFIRRGNFTKSQIAGTGTSKTAPAFVKKGFRQENQQYKRQMTQRNHGTKRSRSNNNQSVLTVSFRNDLANKKWKKNAQGNNRCQFFQKNVKRRNLL